ncbi:calcium-binding protein [Tropicimonas sp. TH_r6]|uniref:EF-hand domain-containing protein n=1 Tax=Tropicimonas sp. TH_r6 TaxID=3082085 RepID=UPI002952D500|nr:calcium-binding protein [Tropicimonas sp. TH_r6]MDV7143003.1 calcium-binding protein [Tropicimonas sp. TH_r6]
MKRSRKLAVALVTVTALGGVLAVPVLAHGTQGGRWMQEGHGMPGAMMGNVQGGDGMMSGQGGPGAMGGMMQGQGGTGPISGMMSGQGGPGMSGGMMGNPEMMQQMMQMHQNMGSMMGANGGPGMMSGQGGPGAMMGGLFGDLDTDGDGTVTAEEAHDGMQARLEAYDADGDGSLTLEEFQALHAESIRTRMVDRFQALDEDGDGKVTADEITAPADRMARMQSMHQTGGMAGDDAPEETKESN